MYRRQRGLWGDHHLTAATDSASTYELGENKKLKSGGVRGSEAKKFALHRRPEEWKTAPTPRHGRQRAHDRLGMPPFLFWACRYTHATPYPLFFYEFFILWRLLCFITPSDYCSTGGQHRNLWPTAMSSSNNALGFIRVSGWGGGCFIAHRHSTSKRSRRRSNWFS